MDRDVLEKVLDSRSVSEDPDGVDAVLGEAAALQEGAVVADFHALAGEVTGLEELDAVMFSMLRNTAERTRLSQIRYVQNI